MQFKQDSFFSKETYSNCIPACGEGARRFWPQSNKYRRTKILELKNSNINWKTLGIEIRKIWDKQQQKSDLQKCADLMSIIRSPAALCMYSKDEKKWIRKNFRVLNIRLQKNPRYRRFLNDLPCSSWSEINFTDWEPLDQSEIEVSLK